MQKVSSLWIFCLLTSFQKESRINYSYEYLVLGKPREHFWPNNYIVGHILNKNWKKKRLLDVCKHNFVCINNTWSFLKDIKSNLLCVLKSKPVYLFGLAEACILDVTWHDVNTPMFFLSHLVPNQTVTWSGLTKCLLCFSISMLLLVINLKNTY